MPFRSYDSCGSDTPLLGETIGQCLDRVAATYPDNELLVSIPQDLRFTYREFVKIVNRAAKAFLNLGIRRGDRVAIWSINNYEWVVAQLATARIGAVLVNVNPAYRTHELEYVLKESRARALLLIQEFKKSNYVDMFYEVCPEARDCEPGHIESWRFPHLKSVIFIGREQHPGMFTRRSFAELGDEPDDAALSRAEQDLDIDDIINIQYTSGTTGFPKGVLLTHNNILNNGYSVGEILGLTPQDRVCVPVPFYHCFGMVISNLGTITHGGTIVVPSASFESSATLRAVHDEKCTVLHGVPTMFIAELDDPDFSSYDLSTLRTGIMAGAPCPIELMRQVVDKMHMKQVLIAYGQTEASPATTLTRPDDPIELRVSTVGRVMPHQELKIIDPGTGKTVARGETGEICFRGYMVMAGYDNNEEATAEAVDKRGWLHSGDLGTMDDDGYVKITGRSKNMIIRGGENIYPREIEEFLYAFDFIADAQVVSVPDEKYGEELVACLRLHGPRATNPPTPAEFKALCDGKIAHFKIPRFWRVVDEYPMTITGKVQKFKLREMMQRELEAGTLPDAKKAQKPVGSGS
ncbi:MAG: AMP-binding protein [Planctomycetota bacterium]|jgi:fatty-acyl-CoA synthase